MINTTEKPNRVSDHRCLTDAELEDVHGGLIDSATMAAMHYSFTAGAGDLIFGDKGFAADAAKHAAWDYLRGH